MKLLIPLLSLLTICFSGNVSNSPVAIPDPVNDVLSNQYGSDCHLNGPNKAMDAVLDHCGEVSNNIWKSLGHGKPKLEDLIKSMCQADQKLKSLSKNLVIDVCKSDEKKQSTIVEDITKKTCPVMYTLIDNWTKNITTGISAKYPHV